MNLIVWLVIGACAGSLVAMTQGSGRRNLGLFANVALGVAGAIVGGMLVSPGDFANAALTVDNFAMALVGAVAVLAIANALRNYALR